MVLTDSWRHEVAASTATGHRKGWEERAGKKGGKLQGGLDSLRLGHDSIGKKMVVAMGDHQASKALHDWLRLEVEVTEHLVRAPATKQAEKVGINPQDKKGHGPRGTEAASGDVGRRQAHKGQ